MELNGHKVPDFYIIGAAKSGTTSLAKIIGHHPSIYIPDEKEVRYFSREEYFRKGPQFLDKKYTDASLHCLWGDASPQYLFYHRKVSKRIADLYGNHASKLKFIVMLRNPVDRAYSAYWQGLRFGVEERDFEAALAAEDEEAFRNKYSHNGQTAGAYAIASRYATELKTWLERFDERQFHVLLFKDFKQDPERAVARVLEFLEVEIDVDLSDSMGNYNKASVPKSKALNDLVYRDSLAKRAFKALFPENMRKRIKDVINQQNQQEIDYQPMAAETRAHLIEKFEPEVQELEQMLGRSLDAWRK